MAKATRKIKTRKRKVRINVKQDAKLVHKSDKTRVERREVVDSIPIMPTQMPRNNGAVMRIKIKRK